MKYHKIRNVDINICTCEQKISYNLASSYADIFVKSYREAKTGIQKSEVVHYAVKFMTNQYMNGYEAGNYDIDSINCCLRAGLQKYFESGAKILNSYEEIGKAFPAYYL